MTTAAEIERKIKRREIRDVFIVFFGLVAAKIILIFVIPTLLFGGLLRALF